jgi:hypothetical protein
MNYPAFYDTVEAIKLQDPLASLLGAFEKGEYEVSYIEVVKAAGHSCPTVAGAYLMTEAALKALYKDERAVRGMIDVSFKEKMHEGVAGVIGNVVSHITGATDKSGFKGIGGKFARHSLMHFEADITSSARFVRLDTQESVEVVYDPSSIPASPEMMPIMKKMNLGDASAQEIALFGQLWQERVEKIFQNKENVLEILKK